MSRLVRNLRGVEILRRKNRNILPYSLAVGQVTNSPEENTREIKVLKMEQNEYLRMYFNKSFKFLSVDENASSTVGDIVLIKKLKNPPTQDKQFGIEKVLFKVDNIIDPITGRSNNHDADILTDHLNQLSKKATE